MFYKIKSLSNNKYLYRTEIAHISEGRNGLFAFSTIVEKPFFTKNKNIAKLFKKRIECERFIKHSAIKQKYQIKELDLFEKNLCDEVINSERGVYVFLIQNNLTKKFINSFYLTRRFAKINYSKNNGRLFMKHSVAKSFKESMISHNNGWGIRASDDTKKELEKSLDIIPYTLEHISKRELLIEKRKFRIYFKKK